MAVATACYGSPEEHVRRMWQLIAFLGRHGRQPADVCLSMTYADLTILAESVGELLREESDAMRMATDA